MTAVLPPVRTQNGRHAAPAAATTGSLGPIPAEMVGRGAHGAPAGLRDGRQIADPRAARRPAPQGPQPLNRAARTAGLSLAALGALAGAGGAAAHGLVPTGDEPAATGEFALPTLAASSMTLPAAPQVPSAITAVMPVAAPAVAQATPQYKTVSATTRQAAAAKAAAPAAPAAPQLSAGAQMAQDAIEAAESRLGKPYVWGATGPNSFDCSGLMQYAFEKAGKDLPRTSAAQSKVGQKVSMDDLQPGDLIFLYSPVSHVVMYVGDGKVIEAPTSGQDVKYTPLSKIEKNAVGARRVV